MMAPEVTFLGENRWHRYAQIPKGRLDVGLVKGPKINQVVGTVSHRLFKHC